MSYPVHGRALFAAHPVDRAIEQVLRTANRELTAERVFSQLSSRNISRDQFRLSLWRLVSRGVVRISPAGLIQYRVPAR